MSHKFLEIRDKVQDETRTFITGRKELNPGSKWPDKMKSYLPLEKYQDGLFVTPGRI